MMISGGADPLVRAGPPGPAFTKVIKIRQNARKADEGVSPRTGGIRPTQPPEPA